MGAFADRAALVELLGVLAYGELTGFERLADDARMAPTLAGRAALAELATTEIGHYRRLVTRLEEMNADPEQAMAPFVAALDGFHATTTPTTWLEGLVKAYVGDGMAADFYREVAEFVDDATKALVLDVLADAGSAAFVVREVRAASDADPALAGRLALWARRLVGEVLDLGGMLDKGFPGGTVGQGNWAHESRISLAELAARGCDPLARVNQGDRGCDAACNESRFRAR